MASWLNDITYEDVRALNVAVENLDTIKHSLLPQEGFQRVFCRQIHKIVNFLCMLSTFQSVVGVDKTIKQVKTLHCVLNLSTLISTAIFITINVQDGQNGRCKNHRFELSFTSLLTK